MKLSKVMATLSFAILFLAVTVLAGGKKVKIIKDDLDTAASGWGGWGWPKPVVLKGWGGWGGISYVHRHDVHHGWGGWGGWPSSGGWGWPSSGGWGWGGWGGWD